MANLGMQNFAPIHVLGRTISDPKTFCTLLVNGVFSNWFEIKLHHQITHGSKHLYNLIQRNDNSLNEEIRKVALDAVQRNGYFAHPESLLIAMLRVGDEQIRNMAVVKVIALCKELVLSSAAEESSSSEHRSSSIRLFHLPTINMTADVYYQLADIETCSQ